MDALCGVKLDTFFTSIKQWKILKSDQVGLKRYSINNGNVPEKFAAKLGLTALDYCSPSANKTVPILYNRFWADDRLTAWSSEEARIRQTHDPEWFDEDGAIFLRTPDNKTDYEATWGNYQQLWLPPNAAAVITGLS